MSFDYAKARLVAKSLIEKFGQAGTFTVKGSGGGGYDENGNPVAPQPDVVINGTVTPLLSYKQQEIDGERILSTDSYVFAHSDIEPPIDSVITINGSKYIVKNIMKLDSVDNINVYRKIQLRR